MKMHMSHEGPHIDGILLGESPTNRRRLAPESIRVIEMMRKYQQAIREQERLRYLAYHDSLTGLPNARAFTETFESSADTAIMNKERLGLALIDIVGLKFANDTYGHDKGNELIKSVAEVLRSQSRTKDEAFRIGGDEFAIILPSYEAQTLKGQHRETLDAQLSKRYVERAQDSVKRLGLPLTHVGLNIAVSAMRADESPKEFFIRVDDILIGNKPKKDDSRLRPID